MIISDLEFYLVEVPCNGRDRPIRSLVVRLATESGLEGWGEGPCNWGASELVPRREMLWPSLAGRSVADIEELLRLEALRSPPLRLAVEMASWDLLGRTAGLPLCDLFGGRYRPRIPLAVRPGGNSPEQTARLAQELADQGFHTQIATSTGRIDQDLRMLSTIHQAVGDRIELRLDGAGQYDPDTARELCSQLGDDWLQFFLDPLAADELDQMGSLRRQTSVPLAVSRAVIGAADMLEVVRSKAAPNVVINVTQTGGLLPAGKCAVIADAAELHASLSSAPHLGIGTAAMLHLAAATPALAGSNESAYHQLQDDLLTEPLEIVDAMIAVPQGPGLGVEVDRGKLEALQMQDG
jgi:L-alanine-DL-glutamate epimerase-like enolase superfamily enzyme